MSVKRMLRELDSREISEWMAFGGLDPFGGLRGDVQAGMVAAAVMNAAGGKKDGEAFSASDFLLEFGPKPEPEIKNVPLQVMQVFGAIEAKY